MRNWLAENRDDGRGGCACDVRFEDDRLVVDGNDCPGRGALEASVACRTTAIEALCDADVRSVRCRAAGRERAYLDDAAALLVAAGRFVERIHVHDVRLARRAASDPLSVAREATGRAGPVSTIAAETGLAILASRYDGYDDALRPHVGPTVGHARFRRTAPSGGQLVTVRRTSTDATVRRYEMPGDAVDRYHLEPVEATLDDEAMATISRARSLLAHETFESDGAPQRAIQHVADDDLPIERLGAVLRKHTADLGVLVDLFADPLISDVFVNAPVEDQPLGVRVDGDLAQTNVRVSRRGSRTLASTFRMRSERPFSRANPTLDATVTVADRTVRVAGTTTPVSDGHAFAFRAHDESPWTLERLVRNGTITPDAAGLLSVVVERAGATLVAGTRGAGKTTLLGALLRELPPAVRTIVIEDTPELPVAALQQDGRNVQALRVTRGDGPGISPVEALRTSLRLGEGAIVVGEVRGQEASVLYEAMRVGASGSAVLGTIHGDGAESVRERVVSDLDVPESSFATTDLVVTLESVVREGRPRRQVCAIEEVVGDSDGVRFAELFALSDGTLESTGRLGRAASRLLESLKSSEESYADLLATVAERGHRFRAGPSDGDPPGTSSIREPC